ncbi:bifunctional phosphoribosyl-AMP cyclohydrolase/phosphoribosyl-ATP diphosphatase HisIE [Parashewanella curva]|uniref:Histidine biosynthesis bifunctional protein HisIE n=1 Tax=Parashewanella curva TaxID=2338552 RepID=A0A3L8PSK6_9GAMM|nr:bifunctional phosphoribosyl-AMP cyclohydrolase/phosphoribosyl-ATP diphosphatase HisIE [Parashewanella curva]RLV58400.1 bifunctional phosphoribosyl-AMP cyclohydrolase/phosphoribosyl-ATP diphosphatase HisIE [Parashewanella curva]
MTKITPTNLSSIDWEKQNHLVPAIVQDYQSGQVLMLGYMNVEALNQTLTTKQVTFFSRSKQRLWVKGESSGNTLNLVSASIDCDKDSLLIQAIPNGPTCHLGTISCWNDENAKPFLLGLSQLIKTRKNADSENSYTKSLFDSGVKRIAQKVGEEGVEVALAATVNDKEELINESADLLFHLMVLLESQNLSLKDTISCLQSRHKQ